MNRHHFKVTLLADVVLTARAATEGQRESLNYLPGAKFMGILAKDYDQYDNRKDQLDLFHNGQVIYGNAYPYLNGQAFLPIPATYFKEKGASAMAEQKTASEQSKQKGSNSQFKPSQESKTDQASSSAKKLTVFLQHLGRPKNLQTKQLREEYLSADGNQYLKVQHRFKLKSARDAEQRRSAEGAMFGYFALPKGSVWSFSVIDRTGRHGESIRKLVGEHRIGRSRTAQYGLVRIEAMDAPAPVTRADAPKNTTVYAAADLCFYDPYGRTTVTPTAQQLGFGGRAKIDWSTSQVRSRTYANWNTRRWNRDADRQVVQRGSVFVIKDADQIPDSTYIGSHHTEGFGAVLYNPAFLEGTSNDKQQRSIVKLDQTDWLQAEDPRAEQGAEQSDLIKLLDARAARRSRAYNLNNAVNGFLSDHGAKFKDISSSQWGTVRNYARHAAGADALNNLVFGENEVGILTRGQSKNVWRPVRETLKKEVEAQPEGQRVDFLVKLATEMAKKMQNEEKQSA